MKTSNQASNEGENTRTIEVRAYELWLERGSPIGSPEIDWQKAELELRTADSSTPMNAQHTLREGVAVVRR
jgi:hypothetical protein